MYDVHLTDQEIGKIISLKFPECEPNLQLNKWTIANKSNDVSIKQKGMIIIVEGVGNIDTKIISIVKKHAKKAKKEYIVLNKVNEKKEYITTGEHSESVLELLQNMSNLTEGFDIWYPIIQSYKMKIDLQDKPVITISTSNKKLFTIESMQDVQNYNHIIQQWINDYLDLRMKILDTVKQVDKRTYFTEDNKKINIFEQAIPCVIQRNDANWVIGLFKQYGVGEILFAEDIKSIEDELLLKAEQLACQEKIYALIYRGTLYKTA